MKRIVASAIALGLMISAVVYYWNRPQTMSRGSAGSLYDELDVIEVEDVSLSVIMPARKSKLPKGKVFPFSIIYSNSKKLEPTTIEIRLRHEKAGKRVWSGNTIAEPTETRSNGRLYEGSLRAPGRPGRYQIIVIAHFTKKIPLKDRTGEFRFEEIDVEKPGPLVEFR
jgi:hypothetical protein